MFFHVPHRWFRCTVGLHVNKCDLIFEVQYLVQVIIVIHYIFTKFYWSGSSTLSESQKNPCDGTIITIRIFLILQSYFCSTMASFHWEILIMLLSQFDYCFHWLSKKIKTGFPVSLHSLVSVLLLLLVNFGSGFRLELMYISHIASIRSNLSHLHGFQ